MTTFGLQKTYNGMWEEVGSDFNLLVWLPHCSWCTVLKGQSPTWNRCGRFRGCYPWQSWTTGKNDKIDITINKTKQSTHWKSLNFNSCLWILSKHLYTHFEKSKPTCFFVYKHYSHACYFGGSWGYSTIARIDLTVGLYVMIAGNFPDIIH